MNKIECRYCGSGMKPFYDVDTGAWQCFCESPLCASRSPYGMTREQAIEMANAAQFKRAKVSREPEEVKKITMDWGLNENLASAIMHICAAASTVDGKRNLARARDLLTIEYAKAMEEA